MSPGLTRSVPLILILLQAVLLPAAGAAPSAKLTDDQLLDLIQERALDYFIREKDPYTGLVRDRAANSDMAPANDTVPASIAATGFALTAYAVGVERDWMDIGSAREMTRRTLDFFLNHAPQEHGFFYHFMEPRSGARVNHSEVSPIDTALFLAGALFAAEYYEDSAIRELALKIYERVEWPWMLHGGSAFAMAWSPETGFHKNRWDSYNESMIMYLLAIGSPTHPVSAETWKQILRPAGSYKGHRLIVCPPLFTHQYSHIWIDFRDKNDGFADYFRNSVEASLAHRQFALDQAERFQSYGRNSWGFTASDGPQGYRAYGAPPGWAEHDGTIAPTACGSSIVFTPEESKACLRHFYEELGERIWGRYGFADAFNLDQNWVSRDVIGIDQGPLLLMIENYRSGLIWKTMMKNTFLQGAMTAAGFRPGTMEIPWPEPPRFKAPYLMGGIAVDGYLRDWPNGESVSLDRNALEFGSIKDEKDLAARKRFGWDEQALYFVVQVTDEELQLRRQGRHIWQDDAVELYADPADDGFYWENPADFQLGFRISDISDDVHTWSWFQGGEDPAERGVVSARGFSYPGGYVIEGSVAWRLLGIEALPGREVPLSLAVNDVDRRGGSGKLQWFFRNEEELKRFRLGRVVLEPGKEAVV